MSPTEPAFGRLHETLRIARKVLLVAHKKPDGDTLGSSSSVLNWLLREGKDVRAFCRDLPPACYRYLDNVHRYTNDPAVFDDAYDVVIIFDSGDLRYCGVHEHMPRLAPGYHLVNLDHHVTNERFAQTNIVLTDASSTAEVVYRFYAHNGVHVDAAMATSLLTGLLTDTSSFSNAATNPLAMEAAGAMLSAGARHGDILKHLMHNKTILSLKLWGKMLSRLRYNPAYDMVATYILDEDMAGLETDDVEGASNFLSATVGEADAIMTLRELPGGLIKGSFRSVNRDVSKVAKLLGGGGHKKAAGFTVAGRIAETPDGPIIVPA